MVGTELAEKVRKLSIEIYLHGAEYARQHGIIIADTKFEFGLDDDGTLYLIDEVLTPDSSRFWPADQYAPGISPPSFDKQFVRDYLETLNWDKQAPGPKLPADVITKTAEKYLQALQQLTRLNACGLVRVGLSNHARPAGPSAEHRGAWLQDSKTI